MQYNIVLAGVGGQGILTAAKIIAAAAMNDALQVKQAEIHGMAQRGGAVEAHLRIADRPLHSPVIGQGCADMVLALEPLEAIRRAPLLKENGAIVSCCEPVLNIPDYGDIEEVLARLMALRKNAILVPAGAIASSLGNSRAASTVMVGAASLMLPIEREHIRTTIADLFMAKGDRVRELNLQAFEEGIKTGLEARKSISSGQHRERVPVS